MLLHSDLIEMKQRVEYLLTLNNKLINEPYDGYTNHNQYLYSSKSKDLLRFVEDKVKRQAVNNYHRDRISA